MIQEALDQINEMTEALINDERLIPNIAKISKKLFYELVATGFTPDQAVQIVANYKMTG